MAETPPINEQVALVTGANAGMGLGTVRGLLAAGYRVVATDIDISRVAEESGGDRLLALDEALRQLEAEDPRKAELVKLRFFAGLTAEQAALALGVSLSTAEKDWAYARSWLRVTIDRLSGPRT